MLVSILWFLIIFSVVVVAHEFGHYIVARANGIRATEFFVGFGPELFHFTKGGTRFSLKLLPLGGACVFEGMDGLEEENLGMKAAAVAAMENNTVGLKKKSGSLLDASPWARLATYLAGPFFNFILGFLIAFIMVNMIQIREPVASDVLEGGAAQMAGLQAGDRIISLNGSKICLYEDIVLFNALFAGGDVLVVYERDGQQYNTVLQPQYSQEYGRFMLGIVNNDFIELQGLDAFRYTWYEMRYNLKMVYGSLGMLLRGQVKSENISGPVGIAVNVVGETYEQTKEYGFGTVLVNMLNITLMLTVNLGILNLLPIPALDGGRILFVLIEILMGKPVPRDKEALVHMIGTVFFLVLIVLIFFNDLKNVFGW